MRPSACSQFRTKPLMLILCRDVQRPRLLCKMYLSTPQCLNFFSIIKPGHVCRTKKIHRTETTLWKPPVQMLNTTEMRDTTCCTR